MGGGKGKGGGGKRSNLPRLRPPLAQRSRALPLLRPWWQVGQDDAYLGAGSSLYLCLYGMLLTSKTTRCFLRKKKKTAEDRSTQCNESAGDWAGRPARLSALCSLQPVVIKQIRPEMRILHFRDQGNGAPAVLSNAYLGKGKHYSEVYPIRGEVDFAGMQRFFQAVFFPGGKSAVTPSRRKTPGKAIPEGVVSWAYKASSHALFGDRFTTTPEADFHLGNGG